MSCTVVSCYYEIPSKRTIEQYREWIDNFMLLDMNTIIFSNSNSLLWLKEKYPENDRRKYICKEIESFITNGWDWSYDEEIDHEKNMGHNKQLYMLWNEKPFFIEFASNNNIYNSDIFLWCDIGCFRDITKMDLFKSFPYYKKLSKDKIQFLKIKSDISSKSLENIHNVDERFRYKNMTGGTIFSVPLQLIKEFSKIHFDMINEFDKKKLFKGKDQTLYTFEILQNPNIFEYIEENKAHLYNYDHWFYLHIYWSKIEHPLHFLIVGPGLMPIPPTGWGAVEILIWDYKTELENLGHAVTIINTQNMEEVINFINYCKPDVVHIQYDEHVHICNYIYENTKIIGCTSHFGYLEQPNKWGGYINTFYKGLSQSVLPNVYEFVLSEGIKNIYKNFLPESKLFVMPNGANDKLFEYKKVPLYPERSIYLAKIDYRKRQYLFQSISTLYFAGNYSDMNFNKNIPNYLGEWTKEYLYKNLTDYGNLVLLSDGEADPLVVKEALMCGLGVVISEYSIANLDLSKKFVTVIPEIKINDLEYIKHKIAENLDYSINHRDEIREYGLEFSWNKIIKKYVGTIYNIINS